MDYVGSAADPTQKMAFKHIFLEKESVRTIKNIFKYRKVYTTCTCHLRLFCQKRKPLRNKSMVYLGWSMIQNINKKGNIIG